MAVAPIWVTTQDANKISLDSSFLAVCFYVKVREGPKPTTADSARRLFVLLNSPVAAISFLLKNDDFTNPLPCQALDSTATNKKKTII